MKKNLFLNKETIEKGFLMPQIENQKFSEAVSDVLGAVSKHVKNSETVHSFLEKQEKGIGTNCPNSPVNELVKYLASQNGQIDKTDPIVNLKFMQDFVFPVFSFERECLKGIVLSNKDITRKEKNLFMISLPICELVDKLYCRWFEKIVNNYHSLGDAEKVLYKNTLKDQLSRYDYTVFDCLGVQAVENRQTWATAFPEEIDQIVAILKDNDILEDEIISNYFSALANAYACKNISQLENLWAEVDKAWTLIPSTCSFLPVHGMENYEHPFGVSPEFRLLIRTNNGEQELVNKIKHSTSKFAYNIGVKEKLTSIADEKLKTIDLGVYITALRAGCNANFRITGQVVPNRQDILATGGKIFIDLESIKHGVNNYKEFLIKHCDSERKELFSDLLTDTGLILHTAAHECTHPMGCTEESDAMLGEKKSYLEEAKATCGGLANILENAACKEQMELVTFSVARVCRFFTTATYKNSTVKAYVNENLVMANLLINSGLVEVTNKHVKINFSKDGLYKWSVSLKEFYYEVIKGYHSANPEKITRKTDFYCQITPEIKKWMELINSK